MGDKSRIEWTEATWNPVTGCTRVSPGCHACYAFRDHDRRFAAQARAAKEYLLAIPGEMPSGGVSSIERARTQGAKLPLPRQYDLPFSRVQLHPERLDLPLRWKRPRMIFVNSMSDLFHEGVPDEFIDRVFAIMALAPQHTFQVLTKRPARMREYLGHPGREDEVYDTAWQIHPGGVGARIDPPTHPFDWRWPLRNVWLGVSAEDQERLDERVRELLSCPAALYYLSCEPLLGRLDLRGCLHGFCVVCGQPKPCGQPYHELELAAFLYQRRRGIDWVIAGGESGGPADRALVERCGHQGGGGDPDCCPDCDGAGWAPKGAALVAVRWLRDQCVAAGVPFFFKQWGGPRPKSGGRQLDCRTWDEMPER